MSTESGGKPVERSRLEVTSDTANIAKVRAAVLAAAGEVGFPEQEASSIALAIDEAVTNVIRHGYEGRPDGWIEISFETVRRGDSVGLQITVCDEGKQVDPATICGRDLDDIRPGGLGTHIIKSVMDEVEYTVRQPAGMMLRVVKLLGTRSKE